MHIFHVLKWALSKRQPVIIASLAELNPRVVDGTSSLATALFFFTCSSKHLLPQTYVIVLIMDETVMLKEVQLIGADVTCLSNDLLLSLLRIKIV